MVTLAETIRRMGRLQEQDPALDPINEKKIDPADVDDDATADDIKNAAKNIIVQLRKASDVKGNKEIAFADGKKKKLKPDVIDKLLRAFQNIQKPADKLKFQELIAKSERDLMGIAKRINSSYEMEESLREEIEMDEGFSPKEIKMAIGVASDKRYAGGNMTGAVKAIEKIKKGLSKHKQVAAVLQRQNEDLEEDYYQVVYYDEKGHTDGEKLFKDKKKADAYADKGNKINKLGGKSGYKVFKVKGKMEEVEVDYDKMFEEAFTPKSLDDVVKSVVLGEAQSGDKEAYQKFFKAAMKKFGVSSPGELSGDKEKEFYDYIDKNWKGDNEKAESADADAEDGDHAEVGKSGKKMKVKVDPEIEEAYEYIVSEGIEMDDLTEEQLDEIIGKIARGIAKGVKKVANRMSASGRADAAEKKADKLEKKKKDLERIKKAKERQANAKKELKREDRFFKEAEMTDAQIAKREEIVKELKKKEAEFKEKYGDRAKEVMYATATKMAMKS
jgi:hypothetical protein